MKQVRKEKENKKKIVMAAKFGYFYTYYAVWHGMYVHNLAQT